MPCFEVHPIFNVVAFIAPFVFLVFLKTVLSIRGSLLPLGFIPIGLMCLSAGRVSILYGEVLEVSHAKGIGIFYIFWGLMYCALFVKNIKKSRSSSA